MKVIRTIPSAAVALLLAAGSAMYAQHEHEENQGKPEKQADRAQPQQHQQQQRQQPQPGAQPRQQGEHAQQQRPPEQAQHREQPQRAQAPQPAQHQAQQPAQHQAQQPAQHQAQQPAQQMKALQRHPAAQQRSYSPPQRTKQQAQSWQQQSNWRQNGAWQEHSTWQQDRSSHWESDHRTWAQRGGYGGYYIPQASFSLHFGPGNWFRIQNQPTIVGGYPRFQYGGYSFMMVDPWPEDWAPNWYASDDVYVGYDNGYYLYNRGYPGEAIAITVVL